MSHSFFHRSFSSASTRNSKRGPCSRKEKSRSLVFEPLENRRLLSFSSLYLESLDGTDGFQVKGSWNDYSGGSVSSAGDVNGDGFDDVIIGASSDGDTCVVFGKSSGFVSEIIIADLDGTNGFMFDQARLSVSSAGDVNGDGYDDLIINGSWVVFGKSESFGSRFYLSTLDGTNGFHLDRIGEVSSAGDVNGDGYDDLIIGAYYADPDAKPNAGETYVVFGKSSGFASNFDLATLDGANGFLLKGIDENDYSGWSVSSAGDVNDDGFDDVIIGAAYADPDGELGAGESYVIFGKSSGFAPTLDLATLDGTNGFLLKGIDAYDNSGFSVSSAGDVNGDGYDDLIIGASEADPDGKSLAGETYVVFGKGSGFTPSLDLATLDGANGFLLKGSDAYDNSGFSVSSAGDVNGDGFDDLIIGAPMDADYSSQGKSYVVYGNRSGFAPTLDLATLDGTNGFKLYGFEIFSQSGYSVSSAGDVNGDGFDDLIIGAPKYGDEVGMSGRFGRSYVVFGGNFTGGAETLVGDENPDTLTAVQGPTAVDILIGGRGDDLLIGDGGPDVLLGGEGDDALTVPSLDFQRLLGGNGTDTLRIGGVDLSLDLTVIPDNKIVDIEEIDMTGAGDNTLTLGIQEVLNISSHSNTLIVYRDSGDTVDPGTGWTQQPEEKIDGNWYEVYAHGAAVLKIEAPFTLYDFGDAPDPTYPTLLANNGARHVATGPMLGTVRDADTDGQPTPLADGDDLDRAPDDEDGLISIPNLTPGTTQAPLGVQASAPGFLNTWIDFNADGDWNDEGEQIAVDLPVVAGVNQVYVNVPVAAVMGTTYTRLRLTGYDPAGSMLPTGLANDGEVEDYVIEVTNINGPPSVELQNIAMTMLSEDMFTTPRIKIADIVVTDDALGTNTLSLSGADVSLFEIDGTELYLISGISLDTWTNPHLDITVEVEDAAVGTTPDDSDSLTIAVTVADSRYDIYPGVPYGAGDGPNSIVIDDLNGDKYVDVVTANSDSDNVSVLLGAGDGTFLPQATYAVGDNPTSVALSDVNKDGHLDVVTANSVSDNVSVLLGVGNGTFLPQTTFAVGDRPNSVALSDVNKDGHLDLVTANSSDDTVSVLLGVGDGTFFPQTTYAVGDSPSSVALADVNEDGHLDVVTANIFSDNISVLIGVGNGTFLPQATFTAGNGPSSIALLDANKDGHLDVVTANLYGHNVSVLLGIGDGTFLAQTTYEVGNYPLSVETSDVNRDGHLDVITANQGSDSVSVLLGIGDGAFLAHKTFAVSDAIRDVALSDINKDGRLDIVTANYTNASVSVILGIGDGTFHAQKRLAVEDGPRSLALSDVNDDGYLDVVTANRDSYSNSISVLLGVGDGTYLPQRTFAVGKTPFSVALSDVNADGHLDVVTANYADGNVSMLLGTGDGMFLAQTTFAVGDAPFSVAISDLNEDGHLDVVTANYLDGDVSMLLGVGDGTFLPQTTFEVGGLPRSVALSDVNEDGHIDVVTANYTTNNVSVLLGGGDGTFLAQTTFGVGTRPQYVALSDVNVDGHLDVVTANLYGDNVSVLLGVGDGTFLAQTTFAVGDAPYSVALSDVNKDGFPDIVTANSGYDNVSLLLGVGDGTFLAQAIFAVGDEPNFVALSDMNEDGFPDIVTANFESDDVSVLLNLLSDNTSPSITSSAEKTVDEYLMTVLDIQSIDPEGDLEGAGLTYSLTGGADITLFEIDVNTGVLTFKSAPDYEVPMDADTNNVYDVQVTVTDSVGLTDTQDLTITVTDVNEPPSVAVQNIILTSYPEFVVTTPDIKIADIVVADDALGTNVLGLSGPDASLFEIDGNGLYFKPGVSLDHKTNSRLDVTVEVDDVSIGATPDDSDALSITVTSSYSDGLLYPGKQIDVGDNPSSMAVSDLNGDGHLDVVTANSGSDNVSVLLGVGDRTFHVPMTFATGTYPNSIVLSDVNEDGHLDVVTANSYSDNVSVLLGTGGGTFFTQTTFTVGDNPRSIAISDVNKDGHLDVIAANFYSDDVSVLLGVGNGMFLAQTTFAVGDAPYSVALSDVNEDGHLDVVTANSYSHYISVLLGVGDGAFLTQTIYAVGDYPQSIAISDVDKDGHLDVVTASSSSDNVSVLLGVGDGAFLAQTIYAVGDNPRSIAISDVNEDGHLDVITANGNSDNISVLLGVGDGTFLAQETFGVGVAPSSVALSDINKDGHLDVVAANSSSDSVTVLFGDGNGTFQAQTTFAAGDGPYSVALSDVNEDGHLDILSANYTDNNVSVLLGVGDGTFLTQTTYAVGNNPRSVLLSDVNEDGHLDVLTANSTDNNVSLLLGVGDGTFQAQTTFGIGFYPSSVALSDVNEDGHLDIVTAYCHLVEAIPMPPYEFYNSVLSVRLGVGDGTFLAETSSLLRWEGPRLILPSVALSDVNEDGHVDVVMANSTDDNVLVKLGVGDGTFLATATYNVEGSPKSVALSDVNNDGHLDIVTANVVSFGSGSVSVLLGAGDGTFLSQTSFPVGDSPVSLALSDVNKDGHLDVVTANQESRTISILLGIGDGTLLPQKTFMIGDAPYSVAIGDLDEDERPDVVTANYDNDNVSVLLNLFEDSENTAPAITSSAEATVEENQTAVLDIQATDPEGDVGGAGLTYSLTSGADVARFDIDLHTGVLTFKTAPNFEVPTDVDTNNVYEAQVTVTDSGGLTDTQNLTITVANVNEPPSVSLQNIAVTTLPEGALTTLRIKVANIVVTDDALGTNILSLSGPDASLFEIDINELYLKAGVSLDYDTNPQLDVTVNLDDPTIGATPDDSVSLTIMIFESFFVHTTYAVGTNPRSVALSDVNEDGHFDVIAANGGDDNVSVLLGVGDGGFLAQTTFAVGDAPFSVVLADVNEDGHLDVVTANYYSDNVSVLLGVGDGGFLAQTTFAVGDTPFSVALSDVNEDGHFDVIAANGGDDNVSVLLGVGDGTFLTQTTFAVGDAPFSVALSDVNEDGHYDVIAANVGDDNVSVLLGVGDGTFLAQSTFAVGDGPYSVVLSDVNEDGHVDALTANQESRTISVLLGIGDGTFLTQTTFAVEDSPRSLAISDLNKDGHLDVVTANAYGDNVSMLFGFGDGTFAEYERSATGDYPRSVALADMNEDGHPDIVTANYDSDNISLILNLLGNSENTVPTISTGAETTINENQTTVHNINSYDLDGDAEGAGLTYSLTGGADIALFNIDVNSGVLTFLTAPDYEVPTDTDTNNIYEVQVTVTDSVGLTDTQYLVITVSDDMFLPQTTFAVGSGPRSVAISDLNDDGHLDVITANRDSDDVSVLLGTGDGAFFPPMRISVGNVPCSVAISDVNEDGHLDIVTADYYDSKISVRWGLGDGRSNAHTKYAVGSNPYSVALSDVNEDGHIDILSANYTDNNVSVLLGVGDGAILSQATYAVGNYPRSVVLSDVNEDGHLDVVTANYTDNNVSVLLGVGDGTFQAQTTFGVGIRPQYVALSDVNEDGRLDVVTANSYGDNVSVLLGVGDGTFLAQTTFAVGDAPYSVALMDLNKDGHLDVVTANNGHDNVSVLLGVGDGTFLAQKTFMVGDAPYSVAIADMNEDGRLDVVTANYESDDVSVLLKLLGESENTAPAITSAAEATVEENQTSVLDVQSTDPEGDIEGAGLTYSLTDGADIALFEIDVNTGVLTFKTVPDFEVPTDADTNNVYDVQVTVTDSGGLTDTQDLTITVTDVNEPPSVAVQNIAVTMLPEDAVTTPRIKVADVVVTDDGWGTNVLGLSGLDATMFEIDGNELYLIAGASLDYDTNPQLDVTVEVDDPTIGATPDDTASLTITIMDVLESQLTLTGRIGHGKFHQCAVEGDYVYAVSNVGLQIFNIADPVNPVLVGTYDTPGSAYDVEIVGSLAYIADGDSGLQIINVADPANPVLIGGYDTTGSARNVEIIGSLAYVADDSAGLRIVNISDPANPISVGSYDTPGSAVDVEVVGALAYIADAASGLQVVNVADPANPLSVRVFDTLEIATVSNEFSAYDVEIDGDLIYIAGSHYNETNGSGSGVYVKNTDFADPGAHIIPTGDYYDGMPHIEVASDLLYATVEGSETYYGTGWYAGSKLQVYDVTDPINETLVADHYLVGLGIANVEIHNDTAYVSHALNGFQIIDIDHPVSARVGGYTTPYHAKDVEIVGDLAYVVNDDDFQIINVADPANPVFVSDYYTFQSQDIEVVGNLAYFVTYNRFRVIDVSDPANPVSLGSCPVTAKTSSVEIVDELAYVLTDPGGGTGWLHIIDISNPALPVQIDQESFVGTLHDMAVVGELAYVASGESGLRIINVSDPANPAQVGVCDTPGDAVDVEIKGSLAYVADGDSGLQIVNVTDPANPVITGAYDTPGSARDVEVARNLAYVADGASGFQVVDIVDPTNPVRIDSYDTSGDAYDAEIIGDLAYVADYDGGLVVLHIGEHAPVTAPVMTDEPVATEGLQNTLYWVAADGADDYYAEISTDDNFTTVHDNSSWITTLEYTFTSLVDETDYYYRVKARADGSESGWSNVESSTTYVNDPPSATALNNTTTALPEDTNTTVRMEVADVVVTDDPWGTNVLSLSGSDAALFEIDGAELYLKAGAALDYETNSQLDVTVEVDDPTVGTTPDVSATVTFTISDVNEAPTDISVDNLSVDENTTGTVIGNVTVIDPDLGDTHVVTVSDTRFEVVGGQLKLKAGESLDFETDPSVQVDITATDTGSLEYVEGFAITVNNVNDPPSVSLQNIAVTSLPEDAVTTLHIKVADVVVTDDALGTNALFLSGPDESMFEIDGNELYLKAGVTLDYDTNPQLTVMVIVDDPTVGETPDDFANVVISITQSVEYDFGDAPDPSYPTLLGSNGARHVATGPMLGQYRDPELDGQPTSLADGDDLTGTPDDEDGLLNTPLLSPGIRQTPFDVQVSAPGFLNAWVDFDGSGSWEPGERIAIDLPVVAGTNQLLVDVPQIAMLGTTYARFRLTGYDPDGTLLPTGLAADGEVEDYSLLIENDIYLQATSDGDAIKVWPGTPGGGNHRVQINSIDYYYDAAVYDSVHVDGLGGTDTLNVYGKATTENAAFDGTSVHVSATGVYDFYAQDFENIYVFSGGGLDTAQMLGTTGNDRFYSNKTYMYLRGDSSAFLNYASRFSHVEVDASVAPGGYDYAYMYDSSGDDLLVGGPTQSTLDYDSTVDPGVDATVIGFDRVDGYGVNGGTDAATFHGSSGADVFTGLSNYAFLEGDGGAYFFYVKNFGSVTADVSIGGGADTAALHDSLGDDTLAADETQATIDHYATGAPNPNLTAIGFPNVRAYAIFGGNDLATLMGSAGDDRFTGRETYGRMKGNGGAFINFAKGFDVLTADVSGTTGTDVAILYDASTDDKLVAGETEATFDYAATGVSTPDLVAKGFDQTYSYATNGGDDTALLIGSAGNDRFTAKQTYGNMKGPTGTFFNYATGFDQLIGNASGGTDKAFLYDAATDDLLTADPTQAMLNYDATVSPGVDVTAQDFDEVYVYSQNGGTDLAVLTGSAGVDRFTAQVASSYLKANDNSYYNYVNSFDAVTANAVGSGDLAFMYGSDGNDVLNASPFSAAFTLNPTVGTPVVNTAAAFDQVYSYASGGGTDTAHLNGTSGPDTFAGDLDWGYLRSTGTNDYFNYVRYFDEVFADPGDTNEGNDLLDNRGATYTLDTDPGNGNIW
jgi:hypothetical protein